MTPVDRDGAAAPESPAAREESSPHNLAEQVRQWLTTALTRDAHEAARVVALHWLQQLKSAGREWSHAMEEQSEDRAADALHAARVAVRRLRATLREHRDTLDLREGRRSRRALRHFGRATNAARDRAVQLEWLSGAATSLDTEALAESDSLHHELATMHGADIRRCSRAFAKFIDPHVAPLERRLTRYQRSFVVGDSTNVTFAAYLAVRLERCAALLRRDVSRVTSMDEQDALHRIRLRLKRQRAMLAPFLKAHAEVDALYALATAGQDYLGAMRDAIVLADYAESRHYSHLEASLRARALQHFTHFERAWCGNPEHIVETVNNAAQALRTAGTLSETATTASTATVSASKSETSTHGLPMEIERKFLLHGLPPHAAMSPSVLIEQGWLPGTMLRERLRRTVSADGAQRLTRTVKLGEPGSRIEIEEPTDRQLFDALWPHTANARIRKRRHVASDAGLVWEVDVFLDRDLVIAEVELDDVAQAITVPAWMAPFVIREVTHDPAYLNSVMARADHQVPGRASVDRPAS
jgi:CYTH domain-containing protein/CHAD domain-containing protein